MLGEERDSGFCANLLVAAGEVLVLFPADLEVSLVSPDLPSASYNPSLSFLHYDTCLSARKNPAEACSATNLGFLLLQGSVQPVIMETSKHLRNLALHRISTQQGGLGGPLCTMVFMKCQITPDLYQLLQEDTAN